MVSMYIPPLLLVILSADHYPLFASAYSPMQPHARLHRSLLYSGTFLFLPDGSLYAYTLPAIVPAGRQVYWEMPLAKLPLLLSLHQKPLLYYDDAQMYVPTIFHRP